MTRIIYNPLLEGWLVVRGPHETPITGIFDTRKAAIAWRRRKSRYLH